MLQSTKHVPVRDLPLVFVGCTKSVKDRSEVLLAILLLDDVDNLFSASAVVDNLFSASAVVDAGVSVASDGVVVDSDIVVDGAGSVLGLVGDAPDWWKSM